MKKMMVILCLFLNYCVNAQQTLNAMFYNLYRFPDNPPANREFILKDIFETYRPDLFMVCELVREQGADRILNIALQTPQFSFARAEFTPTQISSSDPLQQMVFYNQDKLRLIAQKTLPTGVREINHYTFILNTRDLITDSIFLEVFVTHLKSSEGPANEQARLHMIDTFVKALSDIPAGHHVLLAGDFNFYSAYAEPAYQKILDPANPIVMLDPINKPGNWSDNDTFKDIHTQATRTSTDGFGIGGATGGLDDRFDFIMMSQSLLNAPGLSYVPGTYKALGNNGNCFNQRIDHYDCEGIYSLPLRKNLHNMSDHLPVVMQLQTSKQFLSVHNPGVGDKVIFPFGNVAGDWLKVKPDPSFYTKETRMTVYNSIGQVIRNIYLQPGNKDQVISVYTGNMAPGLYYLAITGKTRAIVKFLKP